MANSIHTHPRPMLDRVTQYGAVALMAVMLVSVPLQVLLALTGAPGGLFILAAAATLLLLLPVLLLTSATPAVSVDADGLTLHPLIWKARFVPWQDVLAVKNYPLLPAPDHEIGRRAMVGRKKYRPAEGKMLVIRGLPVQYRVTGFFVGEGFKPVIALTNRTHTDYDRLIKKVLSHCEEI